LAGSLASHALGKCRNAPFWPVPKRDGGARSLSEALDVEPAFREQEPAMRSILLYLIGIPIPIILLLALCTHHF
jgi:hypothetical protein